MKTALFGASKETHLQRSLEAKEMAERPASNFVLLRRTKLECRSQSLALDAQSLRQADQLSLPQRQISAQPAVSNVLPN
jgi:hypothetical protein